MKVTILGSGTCVPSLTRGSCSILIQIENMNLLFDAGAGTMHRILRTGLTITDITHIFFSHLHPDHTGEFASFLFASKYPEYYRRRTPLTVVGAKGFLAFYGAVRTVYGPWIELDSGILDVRELNNQSRDHLNCGLFDIDSCPVNHTEQSIAYRITAADGKSVVYSGDTDVSDDLVALARNADLLVCECALPDELKVAGHLTPSLAGSIAAKADVKKLLLTHFYPECEKVDIAGQCRKTYSGALLLAKDLMQVDLS